MKQIDDLSGHYIICGYGRVGQRLAEDLQNADRPFVVVDIAEEEIAELRKRNILHVQGNAEDEEVLKTAGLERARGLILTLPEDSSNVFVALTAREMNPDLFILARTVDHDNRSKLLHAGADKVIAPSEVGADRMAQVVLRPNVDDFMERILHANALSLQIDEVEVHRSAPLAGQTLAESNFRQQFDAVVIGIIDADTGDMTFNPTPTSRIEAGDILIVLGDSTVIEALREKVCMP
jgi:voltage-gated potassium channel